MRFVSVEVLQKAIVENGVDYVYEKLEALFYEEPLIVIDKNGKAIFTPFDAEELYEYLEYLVKEVEL
jgi:hypothetical protein